jgi:IS5 family transposase
LVLIYEDQAGFVVHHHLLPRDAQDRDVAVEQTRRLQERVGGKIKELSFDCGFHSPENQEQLQTLIKHPCLPRMGSHQAAAQREKASVRFRQARQRHAGVESAIGALQSGTSQKALGIGVCADTSTRKAHQRCVTTILGICANSSS